MNKLIDIHINQQLIEQKFLEEFKKRIDQIESQQVLWDTKTLCEKTSMSINTIKDNFFYNSGFPKHKIGGKWYFPARECEAFLLQWIKEQPKH